MVVILEGEGKFVRTCGVGRADVMAGGTGELDVVLREDAIVEDCDMRGSSEFAGRVKTRTVPDDVVRLPLAGGACGIDERGILAVHRGNLAVCVSFAVVGIEDLNFVEAHQEDTAVAAVLIFALGRIGFTEFDVELAIAEALLGLDIASLGCDLEVAIFDFPHGGAAVFLAHPFGEVFAVEEDDCVRGRFAGRVLCAGRAGSDDHRVGTVAVVDFPFGVDLGGSGESEEREEEGCGEELFHTASDIDGQ